MWNKTKECYNARITLVYGGLARHGISAEKATKVIIYLAAYLFFVRLPTYTRKGKVAFRLPSETHSSEGAGRMNVWCDLKLLTAMRRNAHAVVAHGGDAVLDNHVGIMIDGAMSKGDHFQGARISAHLSACHCTTDLLRSCALSSPLPLQYSQAGPLISRTAPAARLDSRPSSPRRPRQRGYL